MQTNNDVSAATTTVCHPGEHPETGPEVTVKVNGIDKRVHRGSHLVAEFKDKVGVDSSQELDQVVDGQFKPLGDDERVVVKGGEVFVSHARCGGSS